MKVSKLFLAVLFVAAVVPAAFAASTKSDYQKDFDFGRLRTFAFKTDRASNDPLAVNTIEAERIQTALARQLEANGYTPNTENPDFTVAFYSRTRESRLTSPDQQPRSPNRIEDLCRS